MSELDRLTYETVADDGCHLLHVLEFDHNWMLRDQSAWRKWVSDKITGWDFYARQWHDHDGTVSHEASA